MCYYWFSLVNNVTENYRVKYFVHIIRKTFFYGKVGKGNNKEFFLHSKEKFDNFSNKGSRLMIWIQ